MAEHSEFNFQSLFSDRAPEAATSRSGARRGKYDFAVAYPDPASLPLEDLADGLRQALREEGQHAHGVPG